MSSHGTSKTLARVHQTQRGRQGLSISPFIVAYSCQAGLHTVTAASVEKLPCHEAGLLGCEVYRDVGNVLRLTNPTQVDQSYPAGCLLLPIGNEVEMQMWNLLILSPIHNQPIPLLLQVVLMHQQLNSFQ